MSKPHIATVQDSNWRRMLQAIPEKNTAAQVTRHGEQVSIFIRNVRPAYLRPPISWFVPFKERRIVALDALGTRLWTLCDGSRTVEDIIDAFCADYELSFHEAKTCVTDYLKKLVQRGVLAVVIDR